MKIGVTSVFVDNQEQALEFYTEKLGFVKKKEIPLGEFKWLTVVSPDNQDGVELLLEPNDNIAARNYQNAIFNQGIPATTFFVDDINEEYSKLLDKGVEFHSEPQKSPFGYYAVFNDTCGNLIQINQVKS